MDDIINKVAQSGLIEINLEDYYDNSERVIIDMKDFLTSIAVGNDCAYILKEKAFRNQLSNIELSQYHNKLVAITCSVDAIVPTWAYMLLSIAISGVAKKVVVGDIEMLEKFLFNEALSKINTDNFTDAKVVIKGCNKYQIPLNAYTQIANILKPHVKSIMYGEPCSTVPLYKRPK